MLGCIADDVTGATDLAINLVQGGMCVVQMLGIPSAAELAQIDADAVVVALKTRSIPRESAVSQSLDGLAALRELGIDRFFFKYCSTFDSTEQGNIGPVAEALMDVLDVPQTIFCPAFPRNGRTVYHGHLFVNGRLLCESGMEQHPLNPMTDANLVRFLARQASSQVGLLSHDMFSDDPDHLVRELRTLADAGARLVITDSCNDQHLLILAQAVAGMRLVTGGSGIARYLPDAYRGLGLLNSTWYEPALPNITGRSLILSGSCSTATNRQVAWMKSKCPAWKIDVPALMADPVSSLAGVVTWARQTPNEPLLVYSTSSPQAVAELQNEFGGHVIAAAIEAFHASVAESLVAETGVRRLVLAGGETAGAVVQKLGIRALRIGPEICAGVPWTESLGPLPLALALKSGNFGQEDFFASALEMLR